MTVEFAKKLTERVVASGEATPAFVALATLVMTLAADNAELQRRVDAIIEGVDAPRVAA
jgi:hypothetical protein